MLFNPNAVLKTRQGEAFREPKAGERPKTDANLGFEESQKRDVRRGRAGLNRLRIAFDKDAELMVAA